MPGVKSCPCHVTSELSHKGMAPAICTRLSLVKKPCLCLFQTMHSLKPCILPAFFKTMHSSNPCNLPVRSLSTNHACFKPCILPVHSYSQTTHSLKPCILQSHASIQPFHFLDHPFLRTMHFPTHAMPCPCDSAATYLNSAFPTCMRMCHVAQLRQ